MSLQAYLSSERFKRCIPDWIATCALLLSFFFIFEVAGPFYRQFSLSDQRLAHPFATKERVTDNELYLYTCIAPSIIITLLAAANSKGQEKWHLIQSSNAGFWLVVSFTGVITDILKCWIGNPRPDFLQRCGAVPSTPTNKLVDVSVCSAPLGQMYLADGMKSTPSGHSSLSFAGLGYLTLWLLGQYKKKGKKHTAALLAFYLPLLFATYIALLRTQDYRHHFLDIGLGSLIGLAVALIGYHRYFPNVEDDNSNVPLDC